MFKRRHRMSSLKRLKGLILEANKRTYNKAHWEPGPWLESHRGHRANNSHALICPVLIDYLVMQNMAHIVLF